MAALGVVFVRHGSVRYSYFTVSASLPDLPAIHATTLCWVRPFPVSSSAAWAAPGSQATGLDQIPEARLGYKGAADFFTTPTQILLAIREASI